MLPQILWRVFCSYLAPYQRRSPPDPCRRSWIGPTLLTLLRADPTARSRNEPSWRPSCDFLRGRFFGKEEVCDLNKMREITVKMGKMGWFSYSYHSWHTSGDGTIPLHHWLRISLGTRMGGEAKHIHLKSSWDSMTQFACHYCECLSRYIAKVSPLCWMPVTLHISIISVLYKLISSQY